MQSFWKQHLLKLLLLLKAEVAPKPRRICYDVLSERQDALDVELIEDRVTEFDLREGELLAELVALTLVRLPIDRTLMQRRFLDTIETVPLLASNPFQLVTQTLGVALPRFPD